MIFTPFQISTLITAFVGLFLGISVYSRERKSKLNLSWFLVSLSISAWALGLFGVVFSKTRDSAWFWQHVLDFSAILIPILFLNFVLVLIKKDRKFLWLRIASLFISIALIILSFTKLFKLDVSPKFDLNYWIDPGILYFLFPLFFTIFSILSLFFTIRECYKTSDKLLKRQLHYVFWAQVFGWGGGATNFFPQLFKVYPFGNYLVILYVIFISYSALKHHLFNIKIIATEMLTFGVWIFLLVKFALSETSSDFIINVFLLVFIVFLGALLIRSVWKEVEHRERLEVLTKKVQKAYEVEKEARKQVEELTEAKTQFIMATQHHLRTPLTSMIGYLDLLFGGTYGKVPPKIKETLLKFQVSTKRLIRVVNALLDISQFQMGKKVVTLEPGIDFESLIKEVMEELRFEVKIRGLYFKYEKIGQVPTIKADSEKLKVALFNIVDNAIKYTKEGGITVSLKQAGKSVQLSVKDTGIGVEPEQAKKLFKEAFARGEEAKKVHGFGRGIGVYITGHIIKAHNGKIWAESQGKDKGTTFFIELPVG
jgi:signal transduction histidine kinase